MNFAIFCLIFLPVTAPYEMSKTGRQILTDEERLNDILFRHYDRNYRPVYNASESVEIVFGINLINIAKMDEIAQVLEISVWLEMFWFDQRLIWTPADFSNLEKVRLPTRLLWMPDIQLYNSADLFQISGDVRAMVAHSGGIFVGPYLKLRSTCILDLTLYPFDDQLCRLIFGSWTYDMSQLKIVSNNPKPVLTQYAESAVWLLLDSSVEQTEHYQTCCPNPFSDIIVSIRMRRRFLYNHLMNIFIPTLWLAVLTLLSFWLDPASGEKISLCVTILVTFTLFQILIAEMTPRTSDFLPLISLYIITSYVTTALVVAIQVFILNLHGLSPILIRVPYWLRILFFNGIGKCLRLNVDISESSPTSHSRKRKSRRSRSKKRSSSHPLVHQPYFCHANHPKPNTIMYEGTDKDDYDNVFYERELNEAARKKLSLESLRYGLSGSATSIEKMHLEEAANENIYMGIEDIIDVLSPKIPQKFLQRDTYAAYDKLPGQPNAKRLRSSDSSLNKQPQTGRSRIEGEIYQRLMKSVGFMIKREESTNVSVLLIAEWRMIAFVLDRLAFWLFALFTVAFILVYLVILPQTIHYQHQLVNDSSWFSNEDRIH